MKRTALPIALACFALAACGHRDANDQPSNIASVEVSASSAKSGDLQHREAMVSAGRETINRGYDKFEIIEDALAVPSASAITVPTAGSSGSGGSGTLSNPPVLLKIRMYHTGEPGSERAVDARAAVKSSGSVLYGR